MVGGLTWMDAFLGRMQGSIGETSTIAIIMGGAILVFLKVASWRIISGVMLGMVNILIVQLYRFRDQSYVCVALALASGDRRVRIWHVYMATDPVSASMTNTGKWWYGALIGSMCVLIRVVNPAFPEGMMLAILLRTCLPHFLTGRWYEPM